MSRESSIRPWPIVCAVGGPIAIGVVLGLPLGVAALVTRVAALPAVVFGVTLLMVPALYIGTTLLGAAPPAREVIAAVGKALRAGGLLWLGVAPAVAFVLCSMRSADVIEAGGMAVVWAGTAISLRVLYDELGMPDRDGVAKLVYICWALVAQGIGAKLLLGVLS